MNLTKSQNYLQLKKSRIIILAGRGVSTNILYNSLKNEYDIDAVILEEPVPRKEFIKKRIKKLGIGKVLGQVLFQFLVAKYLELFSEKRKREIMEHYQLSDGPIPSNKIISLRSVNNPDTIRILKKFNPDLVIVNGTRIISKEVLNSISVKFVNIHAGITPKYRNVHGAYWAVVNNDMDNCGVTVHLVDPGIDTGNIIYQQKINITSKDNFTTYPLLQLAEGIPLLKKALVAIFADELVFQKNNLESKIWHHPTLWQYLYQRILHGKR